MSKLIPALILLSACTLNVDKDVNVDGQGHFTRVVNHTGATVVLVSPDEWSFQDRFWDMDCVDDVLDLFTLGLEGDTLVITATDPTPHPECHVKAKAEDVEEVECEGDGDLEQEGELTGISTIRVTGNGKVDLDHLETGTLDLYAGGNGVVSIADLQANELLLDLSGNGLVELGGDVDQGDFQISGDGDLMARELVLQDLLIEVTGDGDATVTVEGTIGGSTSGSGTLNAYGGPDGEVEVTGTGSVSLHD